MVSETTFDPLAPNATPSSSKHTFRTLERERLNRHPSDGSMDHPALETLVKPHIESFNALMDDVMDDVATAAAGAASKKGKGLLQLGVEDIEPRVVFDGKSGDREGGLGTKITCESKILPAVVCCIAHHLTPTCYQTKSFTSRSHDQ